MCVCDFSVFYKIEGLPSFRIFKTHGYYTDKIIKKISTDYVVSKAVLYHTVALP